MSSPWARAIRLHEVGGGALTVRLEPDPAERAKVAGELGLESLPALTAQLTLKPWFDGLEITGRLDAVVEQLCSVSLEPFQHPIEGRIELRAVPRTSPHAPQPTGGEVDYDPDAPDPPDVLDGDAVDLAAYVVEHLALEIDPFARRPGVEFEYADSVEEESPFAVLRNIAKREP